MYSAADDIQNCTVRSGLSYMSDLIKPYIPTRALRSKFRAPDGSQDQKEVSWQQGFFLSGSFPLE